MARSSFHKNLVRFLFAKTDSSVGTSFALVTACLLSLMLVVAAGALIGFMQFQSRLLDPESGVMSGDIILQADLDSLMRTEKGSLDSARIQSESAKIEFEAKSQEIAFRTERICRSLNLTEDNLAVCRAFLQTIPFNETDGTQLASAGAEIQEGGFDETSVRASIEERLGLDEVQKKILNLHRAELSPIAKLNIDIDTKFYPIYFRANSALLSKCSRVLRLANSMNSYRSFSVDDCYLSSQIIASELIKGPSLGPGPTAPPDKDGDSAQAAQKDNDPGVQVSLPVGNGGAGGQASAPVMHGSTSSGELALRQKNFELVSQYLFYDAISLGLLKNILISPPDFLAFTLTGLCGILGGLLKIILTTSQTGKAPAWRGLWIVILLGLICALIFYALFRGGYLAISNEDPKSSATGLNPFVIAVLALASGLLSDRAIIAFKSKTNLYFGELNADMSDRWGFGLSQAVSAGPLSIEEIAARCKVTPKKLGDWISEAEPVPADVQDDLELLLNQPRRNLFTPDPPQR